MQKLLLIEDDLELLKVVTRFLQSRSFEVIAAHTGTVGWQMFLNLQPELDAVILDQGLPGLRGLEICKRIRKRDQAVPVLFLTAQTDSASLLEAFQCGADDYLGKPFLLVELELRLQALLRRYQHTPTLSDVVVGKFTWQRAHKQILWQGTPLELRPREYQLLSVFLRYPQQVLTREHLLSEVWGEESPAAGIVDVYVRALRKRLNDDQHQILRTIYKVGYQLLSGS